MFDKSEDELLGQHDNAREGFSHNEYLEAMNFPATKQQVLTHLRDIGADDSLIAHVESLTGEEFQTPADVFSGIIPH